MALMRREQSPLTRMAGREWDPFRSMRALLNWDPFMEMGPRLSWRDEERMAFLPAFDVKETKDAYEFTADLPGFREEDVDINVTGNRLTISGKREAEEVEESETYFCSEREYGTFTRAFTLPEGVNPEQVEADLRNGVLKVHVPKAAEAQAKRIPVKAAGESEQQRPQVQAGGKSEGAQQQQQQQQQQAQSKSESKSR